MQVSSTFTRARPRVGSSSGSGRAGRAFALALALALGLAACGDDDDVATTITSDAEGITGVDDEPTDDGDAGVDAGSADAVDSPLATGRQIPAAMPTAIPIPDDHIVLRSEDANYEHSGDFVGVNLAVSGTVDERRAYYRSALEAAYGDVELIEPEAAEPEFRFQGDWFELGQVYVSENEGFFDNDAIDSSDLPVIVTIQLSEIHDTSD